MIRKKLLLMAAAVLITGLMVPNIALGKDFQDHWAKDTIQKWFDNENITGYEDGTFKPENPVTRAEFMTMVNSAYEFKELSEINYKDASKDKWYYKEIQKAVKAGYIVGDDSNIVRPTEEITRQEVAIVITRLNSLEQNKDISIFSDKYKINDWATGFVGAVAKAKYMIGNSNREFQPEKDITRAEALVTLDRAIKDKSTKLKELSIEGAELEQTYDVSKSAYNAIKVGSSNMVTIIADVDINSLVSFSSNANEANIKVTKSSYNEDEVFIANIPLSNSKDTVITVTVSKEGLNNKSYTITVKK